jgi:3-oxoacyl-[acyl-carrier protein] reductase
MTLEQWHAFTTVILDGAFLCSRAALRQMAGAKYGRIINIGGVSAHMGAAERAHVGTAKAALWG